MGIEQHSLVQSPVAKWQLSLLNLKIIRYSKIYYHLTYIFSSLFNTPTTYYTNLMAVKTNKFLGINTTISRREKRTHSILF